MVFSPARKSGLPRSPGTPARTLRILGPEASGYDREDSDRKGKRTLLTQMVQGCIENYDHIMPLYN